jgi:hypothetical protein
MGVTSVLIALSVIVYGALATGAIIHLAFVTLAGLHRWASAPSAWEPQLPRAIVRR